MAKKNLCETRSVEIVAAYLKSVLKFHNISIVVEHQTQNKNRIDITATKTFNCKRRLLVIEAKRQWNRELYTACKTQLYERYAIIPDAEYQGIYLVFWFGENFPVANKKQHNITSAGKLQEAIESEMSLDLKNILMLSYWMFPKKFNKIPLRLTTLS